jgi:hypothetical protein
MFEKMLVGDMWMPYHNYLCGCGTWSSNLQNWTSGIMTRNNLRKRGIPKPLECNLCKEFESVKDLFLNAL